MYLSISRQIGDSVYDRGVATMGKREKVVIVGSVPATMGQAGLFFNDKDFEVWGINALYLTFPQILDYATRWFQLHRKIREPSSDPNESDVLNEHDFPVYMAKKKDEYKNSVAYPKDEIVAEFGSYFNSSVSWMIALAIYEGFKEIYVYGVNMASDEEYRNQRSSCEYFLGIATGRGIKVVIPSGSDLLKTGRLYGFEDTSQIHLKIVNELAYYNKILDDIAENIKQVRDERMKLIGALGGGIEFSGGMKLVGVQEDGTDIDEITKTVKAKIKKLLGDEQSYINTRLRIDGKIEVLAYFDNNWGFAV
jgi:hypothetical protein